MRPTGSEGTKVTWWEWCCCQVQVFLPAIPAPLVILHITLETHDCISVVHKNYSHTNSLWNCTNICKIRLAQNLLRSQTGRLQRETMNFTSHQFSSSVFSPKRRHFPRASVPCGIASHMLKMSLPIAGVWMRWAVVVLSNPNCSMILWLLCFSKTRVSLGGL